MRKIAVALALATTALAGPALAKDKAWYIGGEIGPNLLKNSLFDVTRPAVGTTPSVVVDDAIFGRHDIGYDAGGNIGYDFGLLRTEFEVSYKDNTLNQINVQQAIPNITLANGTSGLPAIGSPINNVEGRTRVLSFMSNGLFDFGGKGEHELGGYVGGGIGIARVQYSSYSLAKGGAPFLDDSDTGFAWQIIAGLYKPVTKHIDVGLKYRFFNVPDVKVFTVNATETKSFYRSHSILLTLAYNFFTDAPPPPPPPPPAPPAPPTPPPLPPCPPAAVTPGPFLVFFDWDKSVVTAEAMQILDRAAEQYAATGQTSVALAGHADKSGKDDYNVKLSQRRADAVRAYMVTKGVPAGVIGTEAFGESRPLVDTADGVREPQNRRVEITFSGAPAPSTGPCTPQ